MVVSASGYVHYAQYDQQTCRYDGSYHTSPFADLSDPAETFHCNESSCPVDRKHSYESEYLV